MPKPETPLSSQSAPDLERREIGKYIVPIKRRACERAYGVVSGLAARLNAQGGIVKVRPERRFGVAKCRRSQRRLAPTDHLRIEPRGLPRVGPLGALAPDQEIPATFPHGAVGRDFQPARQG